LSGNPPPFDANAFPIIPANETLIFLLHSLRRYAVGHLKGFSNNKIYLIFEMDITNNILKLELDRFSFI
jgi:hypothetical protein